MKNIQRKEWHFKNHLEPYFKKIALSNITTSHIEKYKKHRKDADAQNSTINRELATLSHFLTQAVEWKWIEAKPCLIKRYTEENTKIIYLTQPQIQNLLQSAKSDQSHNIYIFILIALETSMRRSEILSIEWRNIDFDRKTIFIPKAKAGPRTQPITQNLANELKIYIENINKNQPWLFPSTKSKSGHFESIETSFRRVVENAELDPKQIVRHTLRHTAITHLVQAGIDLPTVQRISGHKTLQMVARYSHQNGEHIQSAMNTLEKRYKSAANYNREDNTTTGHNQSERCTSKSNAE